MGPRPGRLSPAGARAAAIETGVIHLARRPEKMKVATPSSEQERHNEMQVKTLLNHVQKHKRFVYGRAQLLSGSLVVGIRPRRGSRPICSGCHRRAPGYDTLEERLFQFVPFWGLLVFFSYALRRVDCDRCGVKVETVPWAEGKSPITTKYAWFLAQWAKRMSWYEVAHSFRSSWHTVFRAVTLAVEWGLSQRDLTGIRAIGRTSASPTPRSPARCRSRARGPRRDE